jgi:hypothetical protein
MAHNFQTANNKLNCLQTYMDMLQLCLLPQLEDHQSNMVFQQYGTPPHWAYIVREFFLFWFVRLLALRPLLAYFVSLG